MLIKKIYKICNSVLSEANEIALEYWGKVENEAKEMDNMSGTADDIARVTAKSEIDIRIQELFLKAFLENSLEDVICIDAEEESAFKSNFIKEAPLKVVLDPIDGSLEYIERKPDFSINIALISRNRIEFSMVSFSALNAIYKNWQSVEYSVQPIDQNKIINVEDRFEFTKDSNKRSKKIVVHYNRRTPEDYLQRLQANGFDIKPSNGLYAPILPMFKRECDALVAGTPQIRDILLHEILVGMYPDKLEIYDLKGELIDWYDRKRPESFVFTRKGLKSRLL